MERLPPDEHAMEPGYDRVDMLDVRKRSINRILKYRRRKLEAERNGERVRRSRAKIGEIVPICCFSGQRQAEFCQQRGFELSTQQNYLQRGAN